MHKFRLRALALAGASLVVSTVAHAQYADNVVSYNSGTGFAAGFTNSSAALGAPSSGSGVTPFSPPFSKTQLVSVGAGGEITLQLAAPVVNDPSVPYGIDLILFANEFFVSSGGNVSGLFSHAVTALVQVSADGSTWYTLNPSLAPSPGQLFPTDGSGNPLIPVNPNLSLTSLMGANAGTLKALYGGSAGGAGYDLAWAEDSGGNSVDLTYADYVRIEVESGVLDLDAISETAIPETASTVALLVIAFAALILHQRRSTKTLWKNNIRSFPVGSIKTTSWRGECNREPDNLKSICGVAREYARSAARPFLRRVFLIIVTAIAGLAGGYSVTADTITESFTNNPVADGWQFYGDTNLFNWDSTNHDMAVTWDSSQTNSYFYHALPMPLTRNDDFSLAFDFLVHDVLLGTTSNKPYTFEIAIGFVNYSDATNGNYFRGADVGPNSMVNLVEFDYFPPFSSDGQSYSATVGPTVVASDDVFNYDGDTYSEDPGFDLSTNVLYHVQMTYTAATQTLATTMCADGQPFSPIFSSYMPDALDPNDDFQVDTLAICNYNDDDQDPLPLYPGSIFAHGTVGNFVVTTPPPVANITGSFTGSAWQTQFRGRTNWLYTLERTTNFQSWTAVSSATNGNAYTFTTAQDTNIPACNAFYRIHATQP